MRWGLKSVFWYHSNFFLADLQVDWELCAGLDCQHVPSDVASPTVWWERRLNRLQDQLQRYTDLVQISCRSLCLCQFVLLSVCLQLCTVSPSVKTCVNQALWLLTWTFIDNFKGKYLASSPLLSSPLLSSPLLSPTVRYTPLFYSVLHNTPLLSYALLYSSHPQKLTKRVVVTLVHPCMVTKRVVAF